MVKHKGLITNGFETEEGDWPWHAAIYHITNKNQEYKCGGTLINSNTVLTGLKVEFLKLLFMIYIKFNIAAHCVFENGRQLIASRILVQLGKHNLIVSNTNTQELQVNKKIFINLDCRDKNLF